MCAVSSRVPLAPFHLCFALAWLLAVPFGYCGDWPQIHGPHRNGVAEGERLAENWSTPPKQVWTAEVGEGYAGPAVVGPHVFVFHRRGNNDILDCLATRDGAVQWSTSWPAKYRGGYDSDHGPRCVPIVDGDRVFLWSAAGQLHCVRVDGEKLWSRDLAKDFSAQDGYFGFGSSPLVVGERVLVNVGGKGGAAIVALDASTGTDEWKQLDDGASYSAPILWEYEGKPSAVFVTRLNLVGVRPDSGETQFRFPFGARGPTVNAAAPLAIKPGQLLVTASYRIGAKLLEIDAVGKPDSRVSVVWQNDETLSSQYPTPVYVDGHLYGVHGREDGPPAELRCVVAATGDVKWSQPEVGMAHFIVADNKLLMLTTQGELVLLDSSPDAYRELGRIRVATATTRAQPALSNGQLFIRTTNGQLAAWSLPAAKLENK